MITNIFIQKSKIQLITKVISIAYLLLLSGCLNYIQDVNIYPDGSGKMSIHYWSNLPYDIDSEQLKNLTFFNSDFLKKEFTSDYYKLDGIKVLTDSLDGTTHAIIDISFDSIDSLNHSKTFKNSNFLLVEDNEGIMTFTQNVPPVSYDLKTDSSKYSITYKYTFYGKVYEDNSHEKEGNTLIWKFKPSEIDSNKTIYAKYKPFKLKETPEWIFILTGVIIIIVLFFLLRKSK